MRNLGAEMLLLNLDPKTTRATLHTADCRTIPDPLGTAHKLIDRMGRDGGWFVVSSQQQAIDLAATHVPRATVLRCARC